MDPYVTTLFHHFVDSTEEVLINLKYANSEVLGRKSNYFGFKLFRSMWFGDEVDDNSIDIAAFLKVFKQLKTFTIFSSKSGFIDSLMINKEFMESLVNTVKLVESDKSLRRTMEEIVIVKPVVAAKGGLEGVVKEFGGYFTEYGWGLKVEFKHTVRNQENRGVVPALFLQKRK